MALVFTWACSNSVCLSQTQSTVRVFKRLAPQITCEHKAHEERNEVYVRTEGSKLRQCVGRQARP